MIEKATQLIESFGFKPFNAHCAIEAKPPVLWNKGLCYKKNHDLQIIKRSYYLGPFYHVGRASIYILRTAFGVDWSERIKIIYAGDDATDEEAMLVIYTLSMGLDE